MFTGIINMIGCVRHVERRKEERRFRIAATTAGMKKGCSIACDGACLTVMEKGKDWFAVHASAETLSRTTLGDWKEGREINLERALKAEDELGGHFVSGHVDGVGKVVSIAPSGKSHALKIQAPVALRAFLAEKGSVAVNGVSLTVNAVENSLFSVNVIPYTWEHTTFSMLKKGDRVNIEADMLARYVAQYLRTRE